MILEQGEKVHVMVRRAFERDLRRHFIGKVIDVSGVLARMEGHVYVHDAAANQYIRRPDRRIRVFSLADAGNIINILPQEADLEQAKYTQVQGKKLVVTDGRTFTLDINEFGAMQ